MSYTYLFAEIALCDQELMCNILSFCTSYLGSGFSEIYTANWIDGKYDEWDTEGQQLKRFGEHDVVFKKLEGVESTSQSWFEEAKSHLNISNKFNEVVPCFGLTKDPSNGNYMLNESNESLTQSEESNNFEIESNTSSSKLFTSKLHQFEGLPEPKNATEEEQEVSDFDKSNSQKNNTSKVYNILKDTQNDYKIETIEKKTKILSINDNDEDEIYNNPNFHSEEQDEFELPDSI
ncbi:unnamed protein product [Rhizophagus irregularis]|nr:unnamed protein product [Rhizophagus irregularis]